jgi:hypothetical protein
VISAYDTEINDRVAREYPDLRPSDDDEAAEPEVPPTTRN